MSYILTALQKSEQERREKDQGPSALITQPENIDVNTEVRKHRHLIGIIALLLLCLCGLALLLWQQGNVGASNNLASSVAKAHTPETITNLDHSNNSLALKTQLDVLTHSVSKPVDQTLTHTQGTQNAPEATRQKLVASEIATKPPVMPPAANERPVPVPASTKVLTVATPKIQELYQTATPEPDVYADNETSAQKELSLLAKQMQLEMAEPKIPSIYELPRHIQNQLPKMVYSAHIYSSDADSGFAIINDRRRYRGDRITANLVILSIENNGVVLSFEGETFRLGAMKNWPLE